MLKNLIQKIKNEPLKGLYTVFAALLVLLFAFLFSLCILQADDYYYAAFFKNGLGEFFRLTINHFQAINGRALVHFFLQLTLALPKIFLILINSAILFSIGFFSFKISDMHKTKEHGMLYLIMFYSLVMLSGTNTLKEAVMWSSGFYNYVFPAFITVMALYLCKRGSLWCYLFCFLSGATTEQWGISAAVMLAVYLMQSARNLREMKNAARYLPCFTALAGYLTIFASPATLSRIFKSGHTTLTESLFDITRLSRAFLAQGSCVVIILIFIAITILTAFIKKGAFTVLYSGFLPLALILLLPFHHSYMAAFIVVICYILLCAALFFAQKHTATATFLFGALASITIMLPTNTYDARITFPGALLLVISTILIYHGIQKNKYQSLVSSLALLTAAAIVFAPTCAGFYKNSLTDKTNLNAIREAKQTKVLNYCIDYDKTYAMKQMFNDGWFYTTFLSLYDLNDCTVYPESVNSRPLYYNGKQLKSKALMSNGEAYVPMRAFLNEAGGLIENGTLFSLNGKTLTYLDGMFMYTNASGHEKYLVADNNKLLDFYALYIKLNVVSDAFDISLDIDKS